MLPTWNAAGFGMELRLDILQIQLPGEVQVHTCTMWCLVQQLQHSDQSDCIRREKSRVLPRRFLHYIPCLHKAK